jgi:hypothetical protein
LKKGIGWEKVWILLECYREKDDISKRWSEREDGLVARVQEEHNENLSNSKKKKKKKKFSSSQTQALQTDSKHEPQLYPKSNVG